MKRVIEFMRRRKWLGFWWCSICSAHALPYYDHDCDLCRMGHWTGTRY